MSEKVKTKESIVRVNDGFSRAKQRKIIFDKYEGKCAYCGCELKDGWHVDHIEPVRRKYKRVLAGWFYKGTNNRVDTKGMLEQDFDLTTMEYRYDKQVPDGFINPENDVIENKLPSCASCNINKHGFGLEEFRKLIAGFMKHLNEINTQYKIAKRYGLIQETGIEVKFYFETYNQSKVA